MSNDSWLVVATFAATGVLLAIAPISELLSRSAASRTERARSGSSPSPGLNRARPGRGTRREALLSVPSRPRG